MYRLPRHEYTPRNDGVVMTRVRGMIELSIVNNGFELADREQKSIVGQRAAIRFFDAEDPIDVENLRKTMNAEGTQKWLESVGELRSADDIREWINGEGKWSSFNGLLFAVTPSIKKDEKTSEAMGFIYFYCSEDEKKRAERMVAKGLLPKNATEGRIYEFGAATRPNESGSQKESGLMSSALRESCWELGGFRPNTTVFAFIDPSNIDSQRMIDAGGFVCVGEMNYDGDETGIKDKVYVLDWKLLQRKLVEKSYINIIDTSDKGFQPLI